MGEGRDVDLFLEAAVVLLWSVMSPGMCGNRPSMFFSTRSWATMWLGVGEDAGAGHVVKWLWV